MGLFPGYLHPTDNEKVFMAYVINTREVFWILQKYYDLFQRELGEAFSPLQVTLDFENIESEFWGRVLSNNLLQGLLYGYGERNANLFAIEENYKREKKFFPTASFMFASDDTMTEIIDNPDITNLKLPTFKCYKTSSGEPSIIKKYEKERKVIQKQLKNKN